MSSLVVLLGWWEGRRTSGRKKKKKKKINKQPKLCEGISQENGRGREKRFFDWNQIACDQTTICGEVRKTNSTLISFLVLGSTIRTSPGSGTGLIPLCLPRRGAIVTQGLNQLKTLQREVFASTQLSMALSFDGSRISSDYRLFSKLLLLARNISLPAYSSTILSPCLFLYLSPGTSLFPCPTFQNHTNNLFVSSLIQTLTTRPCLLYTSPSPRD